MVLNTEKKKVLVIDDNEEILDLVDSTLRGSEFEVYKASNGFEGIQIANKLRPDIILLDIMMPELDGFTMCNILKQSSVTNDIPVIFLTALQVGGSDYILKPFSPRDLLTRLRRTAGSQEIKTNTRKDESGETTTKKKSTAAVQESKIGEFNPRERNIMVLYVMRWSISSEKLNAYKKWAELAFERTLMVPGVVEFRRYRTVASSSDQIVVTYEFTDLPAWAKWCSYEDVQKVRDELSMLVSNFSTEIWNMAPTVPISNQSE